MTHLPDEELKLSTEQILSLLYTTACQDMQGVIGNRKGYVLRGDTVPKEFTKEILALFATAKNQLLAEILEQLPEKKELVDPKDLVGSNLKPKDFKNYGHNICLGKVQTLIESFFNSPGGQDE